MVHWDKEGTGASFNEWSPALCVEMRIIFLVRYLSLFPKVAGGSVLLLFEIAFLPHDF